VAFEEADPSIRRYSDTSWFVGNFSTNTNISVTSDFSKIAFHTKRVGKHLKISKEIMSKEFSIHSSYHTDINQRIFPPSFSGFYDIDNES
jgi:hypothetical protein